MKKQVMERILAVMLALAIILSSAGSYSVNATQVNTAGEASVTETSTAANEGTAETEKTQTSTETLLEGDGTLENPFKVKAVGDFAKMQKIINDEAIENKNFILTADIDFAEITDFKPVENFSGTFNGNSHTIKNINITTQGYAGLFMTMGGSADSKAVISNLTLENPQIVGANGVGAIVGIAGENSIIDCCYVVGGNVTGATVGGIVGYIAGGEIKNSYVSANINGNDVVGGVAGMSGANITDTYAYGKVNAKIGDILHSGVGGLVGVMKSGEIKNSVSLADVNVDEIVNCSAENSIAGVGGLVGFAQGALIDESFSSGKVTLTNAGATDMSSVIGVGGLAGVAISKITNSYSSSAVSANFTGNATDSSVRTLGGLVGAAYGDVNDCYVSGGVSATLNGGKIGVRECYVGGVIGSVAGENYSNLYFDKDMNNQKDLKAVVNFESETVKGLKTNELFALTDISKSFALGENIYPYIKSMIETQAGEISTVLSVITTKSAENDKSAELGVGVSRAVTLPQKVKLGEKVFDLTWTATQSATLNDDMSANVVRTAQMANYMTLIVNIGGAYKSYSRLYTDIGAYEANLGNTRISYSLGNNSGDADMDNYLVGVHIKAQKADGGVVSLESFQKVSGKTQLNNLSVENGGFYVDTDVKSGYKINVVALDSAGNTLKTTDMGNQGVFVETNGVSSVTLELSIEKCEKPWGLTSMWESICR